MECYPVFLISEMYYNIVLGPFGAAAVCMWNKQEERERQINVIVCSSIKCLRENLFTTIANIRKHLSTYFVLLSQKPIAQIK